MAKHGEGLGYEIVKAVNLGKIVEPITVKKIREYCKNAGINATENHMNVILPNASENDHSPNYKRYFERIGKGQYVVLSQYREKNRFFWLNVDSEKYNWAFSMMKNGGIQSYSNFNNDGTKRKNESCFKNIEKGDFVLAYETGSEKAVTAICKVVKKDEHDGEIEISFEKIMDFSIFLKLEEMKQIKALEHCTVVSNHRGTLVELEKEHFDVICSELEKANLHIGDNLGFQNEVTISLNDSADARKYRLLNRASSQPDKCEVTTSVFRRNPDVVAEVILRADGICEKCKNKAPFVRRSDNRPFLEVHHLIRLADGGDDTVENAIAVCPNCHRELHFG